jgi:hypothetical protein
MITCSSNLDYEVSDNACFERDSDHRSATTGLGSPEVVFVSASSASPDTAWPGTFQKTYITLRPSSQRWVGDEVIPLGHPLSRYMGKPGVISNEEQ